MPTRRNSLPHMLLTRKMAASMGPVMSFLEELNQALVGTIVFPAANYTLNRKRILCRYQELLATEHQSQDAIRALQYHRLSAVLRHAYRWVPFYTQRFKEIGLVPGDIKTLEDIRHIPPLVRQDVIDHRVDLVDVRYRDCIASADQSGLPAALLGAFAGFRKRSLVRNSTSGSSGTPTLFYEDGSTTALNWVHELRLKQWYGLAPGVKEARMSATPIEYGSGRKLRSGRELFWNQMILPGYFLSDREYELSARKIRKFRPRVLWGPTPALTGLAHYLRRANVDISECRPDLLISRAAPLYDHEKKLLSEVFGCPVTNIYGTRELGHLAMNCPHGSIHVNQENYIVEVEENAAGGHRGGPGTLLVTPLYQSPMPFLRYSLGDVAELGESDCPCGRSLVVLKKIMGRAGEVFKTRDGRFIEPSFWCIAFETGRQSRDVERFQIVYRHNDLICIRMVRRPSYSAETEADLRQFVGTHFPRDIQVEFEYVPEIEPQPSGKYLLVVNQIEKQEEHAVPA